MKKIVCIVTAIAICALAAFTSCEEKVDTPSAEALVFNENGKFKIVQFTDLHYRPGDTASLRGIKLINEVLDAEKPDLVVITGDIVWGKPAQEVLDAVFTPIIERKIPWAAGFGNHDDESDMSREQLMDTFVQMPYCLAKAGDEQVKGVGNYMIELKDNSGKKIESVLYFFDSGAYTPIKGIGKYDWFDSSQINWYKENSNRYTGTNNNEPIPSLAFFHIPLPEYTEMSTNGSRIIGSRSEEECPGKLNTGMFAAMRQEGDIMGTFVGHDHDNDYIGNHYDIALAYGRYSGGNTVYNNLGLNGCRIIELEEGKREFKTYIRLLGGEKIYEVTYPESFNIKKETE